LIDVDVRTLGNRIGEEIAVSGWLEVTQARIDQFADATGDHQWIHVDPVRAAVELPSKSTIAHGFLTLALLSTLIRDSIKFVGLRMAINYGLNRVRFVSPVPSGSRIRARITLQSLEPVTGGYQATWQVTVERDGGEKPACAADWIVRYYPEAPQPSAVSP
jgi:acyl dehydratase